MSSKDDIQIAQQSTVTMSNIIVLLRQIWVYTNKRENFERGWRENKFGKNEEYKDYHNSKN